MYNSVLGIRAAGGLVWELDAGSALSGGGTELSHHIKVCWRLLCQISFLILCMDGGSQLNTVEMENVKSDLPFSAVVWNSVCALLAQKRQRNMVVTAFPF